MTVSPINRALMTTLTTEDGPFTIISTTEYEVLSSGWSDTWQEIAAVIAASLRPQICQPSAELTQLADAVSAYYAGEYEPANHVVVRQAEGDFVALARRHLRAIEPGTTVSYRQLATLSQRPTAIRAAAAACSTNAAALFIPCHRVIRGDGSMGGFRWGLNVKNSLLRREKFYRHGS